MTPNLAKVCTHEAGHAVAVLIAPNAVLRRVWVDRDGHGETRFTGGSGFHPFIAFAGPWAQARSEWEVDVTETTMAEHLAHAIEWQPVDAKQFADHLLDHGDEWAGVLERHWPAIRTVADLLREHGEVDHDTVEQALAAA